MEVLIHRPVIVRDGVHVLGVDKEVVSKARVAQIMHGSRTDEAKDLKLGEVEGGGAGSEYDHGGLSYVCCVSAVVVVVVALVCGLHCYKEALSLLSADHPLRLLQMHFTPRSDIGV